MSSNRSGLRDIVALTQGCVRVDRASLSEEDNLFRRSIRNRLSALNVEISLPVLPYNKQGFHRYVRRLDDIHKAYNQFIKELGGTKAWSNLVLGIEGANELRADIKNLMDQADVLDPDPEVEGLAQQVRDYKPIRPRSEYEPNYEAYWGRLENDSRGLKDEETWHRADDGRMDDEKNDRGYVLPYYRHNGQTIEFKMPIIYKDRESGEWVLKGYQEKAEQMLAIFCAKGDKPMVPYSTLGLLIKQLVAVGNLEKAHTAVRLYRGHQIAMNSRSKDLHTCLNGKVHVYYITSLEFGGHCTWSPITSDERVVKTPVPTQPKKQLPIDESFYS